MHSFEGRKCKEKLKNSVHDGTKIGTKGHRINNGPTPPYPTIYHSEGVKYALCLMVRNADKKVSGASEAVKGSGSEDVKRCKKVTPCKELLFKRGQKDRELALLQRIFPGVIFRMGQRKINLGGKEGGLKMFRIFGVKCLAVVPVSNNRWTKRASGNRQY